MASDVQGTHWRPLAEALNERRVFQSPLHVRRRDPGDKYVPGKRQTPPWSRSMRQPAWPQPHRSTGKPQDVKTAENS